MSWGGRSDEDGLAWIVLVLAIIAILFFKLGVTETWYPAWWLILPVLLLSEFSFLFFDKTKPCKADKKRIWLFTLEQKAPWLLLATICVGVLSGFSICIRDWWIGNEIIWRELLEVLIGWWVRLGTALAFILVVGILFATLIWLNSWKYRWTASLKRTIRRRITFLFGVLLGFLGLIAFVQSGSAPLVMRAELGMVGMILFIFGAIFIHIAGKWYR